MTSVSGATVKGDTGKRGIPRQRASLPARRLKIAIATAGRFHVLDLARELHALGHHVRFYSYVPRYRTRRFGLADECHVALLPFVFPLVVWERLVPRLLPALRERLMYAVLNGAVILRLQPCDVLICMSGIYLEAARFAKRRFGATIWLHRGSRHILSQDEILAATPGAERPSRLAIKRELAGYEVADRIVIPSKHVEESFLLDPQSHRKIFRNTYGVQLSMFSPQPKPNVTKFIIILYVGIWCLRKGSDVLAQSINQISDVRLIHVGSIGDCEFPLENARFEHVDPVRQAELVRFYGSADIFVLPSREDGFGVVLSQALASGLPVICTDRTGGPDLAHTPALAERITVIPSGDVDALASALTTWRDRLRAGEYPPPLGERDLEMLSWAAYARRHSDELLRSVPQPNGHNPPARLRSRRR